MTNLTPAQKNVLRTINVDCPVGIFNDATITLKSIHSDGSISLKMPYVKWTGNTGRYAEKSVRIPAEAVRKFVVDNTTEDGELNLDGCDGEIRELAYEHCYN